MSDRNDAPEMPLKQALSIAKHLLEHAAPRAEILIKANALRVLAGMAWQGIESAPYATWVLGWLYLPKNPPASGPIIAERCFVQKDEDPKYFPDEHLRRTVGCWWGNGRYYAAGHITHWMPLPGAPIGSQASDNSGGSIANTSSQAFVPCQNANRVCDQVPECVTICRTREACLDGPAQATCKPPHT